MKNKDNDTYSYKGWLLSDKWYKRALAVYGYCILAGIIIAGLIYVAAFFIGFWFGFTNGLLGV